MEIVTITMRDWTVLNPIELGGWTGDHLSRRLEVFAGDLGAGWQLKLDVAQDRAEFRNVLDLTQEGERFYVDLTRDMLPVSGQCRCQIRGLAGNRVAHSTVFLLTVGQSLNAIDGFSLSVPSEMAQIEARVTQCKTDAERAREAAEAAKAGAAGFADQAAQQARFAGNSRASAENAAASAEMDRKRAETAAAGVGGAAASAEMDRKRAEIAAAGAEAARAGAMTAERNARESVERVAVLYTEYVDPPLGAANFGQAGILFGSPSAAGMDGAWLWPALSAAMLKEREQALQERNVL